MKVYGQSDFFLSIDTARILLRGERLIHPKLKGKKIAIIIKNANYH
jgi:hypothetical protein